MFVVTHVAKLDRWAADGLDHGPMVVSVTLAESAKDATWIVRWNAFRARHIFPKLAAAIQEQLAIFERLSRIESNNPNDRRLVIRPNEAELFSIVHVVPLDSAPARPDTKIDCHGFLNRIRSLYNIDDVEGLPADKKADFLRDPVRFMMRCDDLVAKKIWDAIEARQ